MTAFQSEVSYVEYLPRGGTEVNAIISITAIGGGDAPHRTVDAAEVIVVDVSGSMGYPPEKIREARNATAAAIDSLRDGVHFAVIAGSHVATEVYPGDGALAIASEKTRERAKRAIARMEPEGGTAISTWLTAANELFRRRPDAIRHAILLTDGRNEHEEPKVLTAALERCAGNFTCDCRGIGADFSVDEVREISSALLGDVGMIRSPEEMVDDFEALMRTAMAKDTDEVAVRVRIPKDASIRFLQQVSGAVEDLAAHRTQVDEHTSVYATRAWGPETRDYHLCIAVPAHEIGEGMRAGIVSVVVGDEVMSEAKIDVTWTEDDRPFTTKAPALDHYTKEVKKAQLLDAGMQALDSDDTSTATRRLGEAAKLAIDTGDEERLAMIETIADVDRTSGTVVIRDTIDPLDRQELHIHSRKTTPVKKQP